MPNTHTDPDKRRAAALEWHRSTLATRRAELREQRGRPTEAELREEREASYADYRRDCEVPS